MLHFQDEIRLGTFRVVWLDLLQLSIILLFSGNWYLEAKIRALVVLIKMEMLLLLVHSARELHVSIHTYTHFKNTYSRVYIPVPSPPFVTHSPHEI